MSKKPSFIHVKREVADALKIFVIQNLVQKKKRLHPLLQNLVQNQLM